MPADEPLTDSPCCDHLHGCGQDQRHFHSCCGHWHGRSANESLIICDSCENAIQDYMHRGYWSPCPVHGDRHKPKRADEPRSSAGREHE